MCWAERRRGRTWIPPQVRAGRGCVDGGRGGVDADLSSPPLPAEPCPKCEHPRAYFMQIQTRSADEPMTTFYKCCNAQCGHRWRD